jgi:uncharacterized membrane protein YcaP (DUF421 family)
MFLKRFLTLQISKFKGNNLLSKGKNKYIIALGRSRALMLVAIIRTIVLYLIIVLVLRLMGKRQVGQLQPFELVIILMISELAAIPSQDTGIPLLAGLLPVLVLLLLGVAISQISLKVKRRELLFCGTLPRF